MDFEKAYKKLISIFAEQEGIEITEMTIAKELR